MLIGTSARYLDDGDYRGGFTEQDLDATYRAVMQSYEQSVDRFAPQLMGHPVRPTLVIQSTSDIAVPLAAAQYLHEHIRGSRLEVIDTEGRLPHVSAPGDVVATMQGFLGGA